MVKTIRESMMGEAGTGTQFNDIIGLQTVKQAL